MSYKDQVLMMLDLGLSEIAHLVVCRHSAVFLASCGLYFNRIEDPG